MNEDFWQYENILIQHLRFVLEYNKKVNLTSIDDYDAGILLHVEDSLSALPEIQDAPDGKMADIGSGGGFPGIPLAVASGRETLLIESVKKKAAALREFLLEVELNDQICVSDMRSEEVALQQAGLYAVVTARAVSELAVLVELASPLLQLGGRLIALKGTPEASELAQGMVAAQCVGMEQSSLRKFLLSDGATQRTLIAYTKVAEPTITLPRRPGMANKRPLT
jgi:16S rRNA (guanine527-N7)-methyltransferase